MILFGHEVTYPCYRPPVTAWLEHGPFAMWLVRAMRPRRIVELGSHYGYSYFAMCEAVLDAGLETECIAIDTWRGDEHSGLYGDEVFEAVRAENAPYARFSRLIRKTFADALGDVEDGSVDLLHVDGRHFYEDVKEDYEGWLPKLAPGAVVMFHDTEVRERDFGVHRFWSELSDGRTALNFRHQHGLGVLLPDGALPKGLERFAAAARDPDGSALIKATFEAHGTAMRLEEEGKAEASREQAVAEDLRARVRRSETEMVGLRAAMNEQESQMATLHHQIQAQNAEAERVRSELVLARRKPLRVARDYVLHKALRRLSQMGSPVPPRTASRFARSAAKRDPWRDTAKAMAIPRSLPADMAAPGSAWEDAALRSPDPARKTVMVISHDASRTGAPVLALDLARRLAERHNVITVLLGTGELRDAFKGVSTALAALPRRDVSPTRIADAVRKLCADHSVAYAIVNSIESRDALPGLQEAGVPSIALLHEFASNGFPVEAFDTVFERADRVVFSTEMTMNSALELCERSRSRNVSVIPQGKSIVPRPPLTIQQIETERRRLRAALRPEGDDADRFVVVGAGSVDMRKGVDLFVECARRTIDLEHGSAFRFVWIGGGFEPGLGTYSAYLADQIERAGLQGRVTLLEPSSEIEHAYELADAFALTSRLDPLPNVAIDALLVGTPVLAFERASGIADFLEDEGLGEVCVIPYLDPSAMADRLNALAADRAALARVAAQVRAAAKRAFDMEAYIGQLEAMVLAGPDMEAQRVEDVGTISASEAFDPAFTHGPGGPKMNRAEIADDYVGTLASGRNIRKSSRYLRKPTPGFHPGLFMDAHGWDDPVDPFARWLRDGQPAGPWAVPVVREDAPVDMQAVSGLRVAVQLHAFYAEGLDDIVSRLSRNAVRPDLFVSTSAMRLDDVRRVLDAYPGHVAEVAPTPNRGRDVGPLLTLHGSRLVDGYDVIGHFHAKGSAHIEDRATIDRWVAFLLGNLLGSDDTGPMADRILTHLDRNPDVAVVFPDDPNLMGWTRNRALALELARRMNVHTLPDQIRFPTGTMFWARADLLRRFTDLGLGWSDYPPEPLPVDGTMLHAIERLIGALPPALGMGTAVANARCLTR